MMGNKVNRLWEESCTECDVILTLTRKIVENQELILVKRMIGELC